MIEKRIENRLKFKKKLSNREKIFGGWVSYREPAIAETFAKVGFDFIAIDMEHTTISIDDANRIITSVQSVEGVCLPRQVSHSNDYMKPLLEAGSDGIIIPMVNSPEEAKGILNNFKFPPDGMRSYGVNRAHGYGLEFERYITSWNNSGVFIVQIESVEAVNNIEKILEISGLDAVMVGPYDISGSLKVPGEINHPLVVAASKKVINACEKIGLSCITQIADANRRTVEKAFDDGFTSIVLSSDLFVLWKWAEEMGKLIGNYRA